jgi:hypothetical protein
MNYGCLFHKKSAKVHILKGSTLGNLVASNLALECAFVTPNFKTSFCIVFGGSALNPSTP